MTRAVLLSALLLSPAAGQTLTEWFVADSADDRVMRLSDLDGDGVLSASEATVFYDDSSDGPDLSTPNHLLPWNSSLLLSDGGTLDAIFALTDLNGDGDANDLGEILPFYDDSSAGPNLSSPNGLTIGADGALYVADDGATVRAVFRMVDLNGDGDALDADEVSVFFDESALLAEPVLDPESIAAASDGSIVIGDTATGRVLRLRDLDGDGTALGAGEATVLYDNSGPVPLADLDAIQIDDAGRVYVVDENVGTILRLEDLNGDGDALDSAEVFLFHDGTQPGALVSDANDFLWVGPGQLVVLDGAVDGLVFLEDLTGDGAALDPSESSVLFEDGGVAFSTPSAIAVPPEMGPPPIGWVVTALTPSIGDAAGGTTVQIIGAGWTLSSTVTVEFGTVSATATVISATELEVIAPAQLPALVDVVVTDGVQTAVLPGAFRAQHRFVRGDVTGDGTIDLADPIALLSHLFVPGSATPTCLDAGDTNDNDQLGLEDGVLLLDYLFGGGPAPEAPFPTSGFDPTPLGPGCATAPAVVP